MSQTTATLNRPIEVSIPPRRRKRAARVIAITSGKGGVGKTNVSVNLAAYLARAGCKVALLDGDLGLANADVLCGINPKVTMAHVVAGRAALRDVLLPAPGGFTLLPGASGLTQMANLGQYEKQRILQLFDELQHQYELLLIDTGAGIGSNVMSFLLAADELLVVTTPDPTSITDAYAVIKAVARQRKSVPMHLLVNMVEDRREAESIYSRVAGVCGRHIDFPLEYGGYIPRDEGVVRAVRGRKIFVLNEPNAKSSLCIGEIASKLVVGIGSRPSSGLLGRVSSWWNS